MGLTTVARRVAVGSVLVLLLVLFPAAVKVPVAVLRTTGGLLASGEPLRRWHEARAGEEVLPPASRAGIHLLRAHRVDEFQLSRGVIEHADPGVPQRLLEGAYPIRAVVASPLRLLTSGEPLGAGCSVVDKLEDMVLARCP